MHVRLGADKQINYVGLIYHLSLFSKPGREDTSPHFRKRARACHVPLLIAAASGASAVDAGAVSEAAQPSIR